MDPFGAARHLWHRFAAWLHLRRGVRLYRRGRFAGAASQIQAALLLAGPSFTAHLVLGKIYLRLNRFDRARQEFAQARFLDPGRFAAQGLPEDLLLEMAERFYQPLWRDARGPGATEPVPPAKRRHRHRDDFSSASERARFRVLPPIRPEDVESIDWSELSRLLDDGNSSLP